jgi:ParB-like chromosome segregation protein Spo0J
MKVHPAAEAFPLLQGPPFEELVADVAQHGLRNPITLHPDGSILDGRNRWRACQEAGVAPKFVTFEGADSDVVAFVVSQNITRRHLDESQRAMVAARLANLKPQDTLRRGPVPPIGGTGVTEAQAARLLNVGERTVQRARKVQENGVPELVAAVERGEVSVSAAAAVAELPKAEQRQATDEPDRVAALAAELRRRPREGYRQRVANDENDLRRFHAAKTANDALVASERTRALGELKEWLERYQATPGLKSVRAGVRAALRKGTTR